jgi:hypothetical protein
MGIIINKPNKGPLSRAFSHFRRLSMSKQVTKSTKTEKTAVFIVLGFDDQRKPRGARYVDPNVDVLTKAAAAMSLNLYEIKSADLIKVVQALPVGRLLSTGNGLIPNIRQSLYSEMVSEIAAEPEAIPRGKTDGPLPVQKGLPETWDAISTGHLVIAQESLDNGWAEAVVIDRADDLLTLRYRDYAKLPKFFRHYRAVALLSQPAG